MASQNLLPPTDDEEAFSLSSASSHVHRPPKTTSNPQNGLGKKKKNRKKNKKNKKRTRANQPEGSASPKKKRILSQEEDEDLIILNGYIEYCNSQLKSKDIPLNNVDFFPFVKEKLSDDFTDDEIKAKVLEMKERYFEKKKKGKEESSVFGSPHEAEVFELSKRVWDVPILDDENGGDPESGNDDGEKEGENDMLSRYAREIPKLMGMSGTVDENMVMKLGPEYVKKLFGAWKKLRIKESELYIKKYELLVEMGHKIVDAMKEGN